MKKHLVSLNLCIIIFFKTSFSSDPFYEACVPKTCGDSRDISYPFFIHGLRDPSCGYPGFELRCSNHSATIRISENDYFVKHIDYDKRSMRLVHAQGITCFTKVTNITLDPHRFSIDNSSIIEVVFLMNCTKLLPGSLTRYRTWSCNNPDIDLLVMLKNDRNLGMGMELCSHAVVVPVDDDGRIEVVDHGNYEEVVTRGFTVQWIAADCGFCGESGGRCGFNTTGFEFRCFCPDRPHKVTCNRIDVGSKKTEVLVTVLSVGVATLFVVIILCFIWKFKWKRKTKNHLNVEKFLKNHEFLARKRYSYSQVKKMSNSFQVKLGQGSFGTVYRGELSNGNLVAVKILGELKGNGEDFINEVASVGRTSHVNIVNLVGFCLEGHRIALIYEFMPNGSLEKFIYGKDLSRNNQLGWEKLHQIAVGIARGLEYLHNGCNTRILHFDIKPHNILLDQDLCPKISDFGLAKLFPEKRSMISMSHMRGTPGYIAPELYNRNFGPVSHKSDVYSYGMMILEMVGGRKNIDAEVEHTSEIYFPHWIYKKVELHKQFGLHGIVSDEDNEMATKMMIVGLWCIQTNPLSRPTITRVLEMLGDDLTSLEIPPKPYFSSPPRSMGSSSTDQLHDHRSLTGSS